MFNSKTFKIIAVVILCLILITFFGGAKGWEIPTRSSTIVFSPNSKMIATGSGDRNYGDSSTVEIRKVSNGRIIQSLNFESANAIAFSSDNKMIAAVNEDGDVNVWEISNGRLIHSFAKALRYARSITFLSFTPDGKTLVASKTAKQIPNSRPITSVVAWNLETKTVKYTLSESSSCSAVSPDRKVFVLSADERQPFLFYKLEDGTLVKQISNDADECTYLNFSSDGKSLVFITSVGDQYNRKRPTQVLRLQDNKSFQRSLNEAFYRGRNLLTDIELSPDGNFIAKSYGVSQPTSTMFVWSWNYELPTGFFGRIRIWHIKSGIQVTSLRGHWMKTKAIAFSPDGKWLASVGGDNKNNRIRLWRMPFYAGWLRSLGIYGLLAALVYWQRNNLKNWINS